MDSDDYRDDDIMTIDVEYVELSSIITQLNKRKAPGHDKVGVIIPIHKTNKPKYQWCRYPPITLLPVIY